MLMPIILVDNIPLQLNHIHCRGWRKGLGIVVVEEGREGGAGDGYLHDL